MNKLIKKISTITLALFLFVALAISARAADTTYTITINNSTASHEYQAWQVFSGTVSRNDQLGNIDWGNGVTGSAVLSDLKASNVQVAERNTNKELTGSKKAIKEIFASATTADDVATILGLYANDSDMLREFAEIVSSNIVAANGSAKSIYSTTAQTHTIANLKAGYYFVKDTKALSGNNEFNTRYILTVVKNAEVNVKGSIPTVNHKVLQGSNYGEIADYETGSDATFRITGTLPTTYEDYSSYKYAFHVELPTSLSYKTSSMKVVYKNGTVETDITSLFSAVATSNGVDFSIDNLKAIAGINADSEIIVTYDATVNSNATVGAAGNISKVVLEYAADPNKGNSATTSKTEADPAKVVTYQLNITKIDGKDSTKLEGVGFKLSKTVGADIKWAVITNGVITSWVNTKEQGTEISTNNQGLVTIKGLDTGVYTLTETTVLPGYNTMKDAVLTVTGTLDDENITVTTLSLSVDQDGSTNTEPGDGNTGIVAATITNMPGNLLPSTGGIGTIIFYVIGGILVVTAGSLYLKKRNNL